MGGYSATTSSQKDPERHVVSTVRNSKYMWRLIGFWPSRAKILWRQLNYSTVVAQTSKIITLLQRFFIPITTKKCSRYSDIVAATNVS